MADLSDMRLFVQAISAGSLSAAGRELGFSPAVGGKRLAGWRRNSAHGGCNARRAACH